MTDLALGGAWCAVLALGLGAAIGLRAAGLAATYVRDLLHVGAGVWILGWPLWSGRPVPIAITAAVALGIAAVPRLGRRLPLARRLVRAVTGDDEHWGGLVLYTVAYAALTAIGVRRDPFPAAAALLALSLGDGVGGAVGRRVGRHHFRAPGGKQKSYEGSLVVAVGAGVGAAISARLVGAPIGGSIVAFVALSGVVAALAEALAPRGTDNLIVPFAVWTALEAAT